MSGDKLRALRKKHKLTQEQLGLLLGYSKSSAGRQVRFFEAGKELTGQIDLIIRYIERYGFLED